MTKSHVSPAYNSVMVTEFEKSVERASKLPARKQQVLAALLEQEMDNDERWDQKFEETPHVLEMLVKRAKEQYEAGLCEDL